MDKCFEEDWKHCRIEKLIKDQDEKIEVKYFFKSKYKQIKDVYKFYAGKEPIDVIWGITSFPFNLMIEQMDIIDKDLSDADVHLKYLSTITNIDFKNNKNAPTLALVRFQLMEVI